MRGGMLTKLRFDSIRGSVIQPLERADEPRLREIAHEISRGVGEQMPAGCAAPKYRNPTEWCLLKGIEEGNRGLRASGRASATPNAQTREPRRSLGKQSKQDGATT